MPSAETVLIAVVAFIAMEPFTAAIHRWVMHGAGEILHRSHHRRRIGRWETNDWYPVIFAAIVNVGLFAGFNLDGVSRLVPICVGITMYGAAYALVHDGYIHDRVRWFANHRSITLDRLADAHRIHHVSGTAPFGMLLPIVPRHLRNHAGPTGHNRSRHSRWTQPIWTAPNPVDSRRDRITRRSDWGT